MNGKLSSLISTISNTFCDFTLDIAVNKYNLYKVLFCTALISGLIQFIVGIAIGLTITIESIPIILSYAVIIVLGYNLYVKALETLPVGLTALFDSASLFLILFIDSFFGFYNISIKFIVLFLFFIIALIIFSKESFKLKDTVSFKKISKIGLIFMIISTLCYTAEPYLVKAANNLGSSEICITLGYYILAIIYFFYKMKKEKNQVIVSSKEKNGYKYIKNFLILIITISIFEAIYNIFAIFGYVNESAIIVTIIQNLRAFLLVILSSIFKTDTITPQKWIATIIGFLAIIGIYLI